MGSGDHARGLWVGWLRPLWVSAVVRQVSGMALARFVLLAIGIGLGIVSARLLGPEGRGLLAAAEVLSALGVQFGILGMQSANTYFVVRNRATLGSLLGNSYLISFLGGGAFIVAAWLLFTLCPSLATVQGFLLLLALALIPFRLCAQLLQSLLFGLLDVSGANLIDVGSALLGALLILPFLMVGFLTPEIALTLNLLAAVAALIAMKYRIRGHGEVSISVDVPLLRQSFGYGIKIYVACLLHFLVLRIDILMLGPLRPAHPEEVGYYATAVSMGDLIYLISSIIGTVLFPRLSTIQDSKERWRVARKATIIVALLAGNCGGALALLARPLIRLLYGVEYQPAALGFVYLMPGVVLLSMNNILQQYFAAEGAPSILIWGPLLGFVANVAVNLIAIPNLGFCGASLTSTMAYAIMFGASCVYCICRMSQATPLVRRSM